MRRNSIIISFKYTTRRSTKINRNVDNNSFPYYYHRTNNMSSFNNSSGNKVIIDTDAGVDDAQALMIALTQHKLQKINVLGITTVTGNVKLQRVIQNVARVQDTLNTKVPIFKGADFPMLGRSGKLHEMHKKEQHHLLNIWMN